jgi:hypothetical protein
MNAGIGIAVEAHEHGGIAQAEPEKITTMTIAETT